MESIQEIPIYIINLFIKNHNFLVKVSGLEETKCWQSSTDSTLCLPSWDGVTQWSDMLAGNEKPWNQGALCKV